MNIMHPSLFDVNKVAEFYSKKDGVDVKYVCTSDLNASDVPVDVFYRETPHPEFGNRYFGLYYDNIRDHMMITNADVIEDYEFGMIQDSKGQWYYSSSHHDCIMIEGKMIDGGRVYTRGNGFEMFKVKDGKFVSC